MWIWLLATAIAGTPRVVGGYTSAEGAWPDAAAIVAGSQGVICTGVLVAPDVVLTAGHCNEGITAVIVGATDYETTGTTIAVQQAIEYPDSWGNYDVTALILAEEAPQPPRIVAHGCVTDLYLRDGAPVTIVGWGAVDARGVHYPTDLHEGYTVVVDADCTATNRGCFPAVSPGGELIAGDIVTACYGDSGGPLYLDTPDGDFVIGLTSRSAGTTNSSACDSGAVYVRTDAILAWVETVTGRDLPDPVCSDTPPENHLPSPTAEDITVDAGRVASTDIAPNDPDAWQHHLYEVVSTPTLGDALVGPNGKLSYDAGSEGGTETVDVRVTDTDGGAATVSIAVTVLPPDDPVEPTDDTGPTDDEPDTHRCGCDAADAPGALPWLALLLLARRRR